VKYKTQLCKNYHANGNCRFGSRCKFIHDEQRIQVTESEHWLVSPSENFVRVEIVDNPLRQAQLAALSDTQAAVAVAQANLTASPESRQATTTLGPIPLQNVAVPTVLVASPSVSPVSSTMSTSTPFMSSTPVSTSTSTSTTIAPVPSAATSGGEQQPQKPQTKLGAAATATAAGHKEPIAPTLQSQARSRGQTGASSEGISSTDGIQTLSDQLAMMSINIQQPQLQQQQVQKPVSAAPKSYAGVVATESIKPHSRQPAAPLHNHHKDTKDKERQDQRERRKSASSASAAAASSAGSNVSNGGWAPSNAGQQQQQGVQQLYVPSPLLASMPLLATTSHGMHGFTFSPLQPQRHLSQQQQGLGASGQAQQQPQQQQPLLSPITGLGILTEQHAHSALGLSLGASPVVATRGIASSDPQQQQQEAYPPANTTTAATSAQSQSQAQQQPTSQDMLAQQQALQALQNQNHSQNQPGSYMQYSVLPFPYATTPQFMPLQQQQQQQPSSGQSSQQQPGAKQDQAGETDQQHQQESDLAQLFAQQLWQQQYASQFQPGLFPIQQQGQQQPGQVQPQQMMYSGIPYSPYQFSYGAQPAFQPQPGTVPGYYTGPNSEQYGTGSQQMQQQQPQQQQQPR
jgi:hypothetical protein